jgi:autotransporter-associated beta strand protein
MQNQSRFLSAFAAILLTAFLGSSASAQTNSVWDGGGNGTGTSWFTVANWVDDTLPVSDPATTILINNRNGTGTIPSPMSLSSSRTLSTITFSNVNSRLPATLNIDTNGSSTSNRTLTIHNGITLADTTTTVAFRGYTGNATADNNITIALAGNNTFSVSAGGQLQILDNVFVTGNSTIEKTGPGTLLMGVGKTFGGGLILTEGRLRTNGSSVQTGGNITGSPFGLGTLTLRGGSLQAFATTSRTYHNSVLIDGDVVLGGLGIDGVTVTGNQTFSSLGSGSTTVSGNRTLDIQSPVIWNQSITGNSSLTKTGNATLTLAGTNSFTGGLVLAQGVTSVNSATTLGSSANLNTSAVILNGGTLKFTAAAARSGSNRAFRLGSANGTIDVDAAVEVRLQGSFRDLASQSGSLRKIGPGTLSLEGATHTFTGGTLLDAGTLRLNGNTLGNSTVSGLTAATGTTLDGYGTINGDSTFADAVIISPATYETSNSTAVPNPSTSATGNFTFNNNLTLGDVSLVFDLDTPSTSDTLTVAPGGVLNIGTGVLDLSNFTFNTLAGYAPGVYPLITTSAPITGTLGSTLTGTLGSESITLGLSEDNTTLQLTVGTPAPADTTPPVITLSGSASIALDWGASYTDAGASATDNVDTFVSVSTSGSVDTAKPGVYTLTYNATDVAGNPATPITRTVTVTIANASVPGPDGLSPLMKYAFGANAPGDTVQAPALSSTATTLSLTAVVRTNDAAVVVSGEAVNDLAGTWGTGGTVTVTAAADQTNLPANCERRVFTVDTTGAARKFLRLKVVLTP